MLHLGQHTGCQSSHMWLGLSSVRSERDYSRFEQPKGALCVGEGWDD